MMISRKKIAVVAFLFTMGGHAIAQTATEDYATTGEDTPVIINVLTNDSFGEYGAGAVPIMISQQASNGAVEVLTNGTPDNPADDTVLYSPNSGFFGTDTFTYVIYDSVSNSASATVTVAVESCPLDLPVAAADTYNTSAGEPLICDVLFNDLLNPGSGAGVVISTPPAHGVATVLTYFSATVADDQISYVPEAGFYGVDSFEYTTTDCAGSNATATVTIAVLSDALSDIPAANDDYVTMIENTAISIIVSENDDFGSNGPGTSLAITAQPENGTATINNNGTPDYAGDDVILYTPNVSFLGTDMFTYEISDSLGNTDTAIVYINVVYSGPGMPVAVDDIVTTTSATETVIEVLANDTFYTTGLFSVVVLGEQPSHGTATVNTNNTADAADDTITYISFAGYAGPDSFQYRIEDDNHDLATATIYLAVTGNDEVPVATDDIAVTQEDTPFVINVLLNDSFGINGAADGLIFITQPANGVVATNANDTDTTSDDTLTYAPNSNFTGVDTFTYKITDGLGNQSQATVTVHVVPFSNEEIQANDDTAFTSEDVPVNISIVYNDNFGINGPAGTDAIVVSDPINGQASLHDNGTPDPVDDYVQYTPAANFYGTDSFTYTITDSLGNSSTATVTINVIADNYGDGPYAVDDYVSADADSPIVFNVLNNDSFGGDGPNVGSIIIASQPANGYATVNDNGTPNDPTDDSVIYTPNGNISGFDSFTYIISDADGDTSTATVYVNLIGSNTIKATAFLDANSNGIWDNGEAKFIEGTLKFQENNGEFHYKQASFGDYYIVATPGSAYNLSYIVNNAVFYSVTTPPYMNISLPEGTGIQEYLFAVTTIPYKDASVNIYADAGAMPGSTRSYWITYKNKGTLPISSGVVTFMKDSNLAIISSSEPAVVTTPNGFTFNFTNLLPNEQHTIQVVMQMQPIPVVHLGHHLYSSVFVSQVGDDVVPLNNSASLNEVIVGSYDPNDITESHGGKILFSDFTAEDYLYYTIRFENTGNGAAQNIRVADLLDPKLDESSILMIDATADYELERVGSQLNWHFNDIGLPPSVENTPIGKGHILFAVKPKSGYAIGDVIPNTASIYFDFNPPIVTNTFDTEFTVNNFMAPLPLHVCEDSASSTGTFNLLSEIPIVLNGSADSEFTTTFYDSEANALTENDAITTPEAFTTAAAESTIYLRIDGVTPNDVTIYPVTLFVSSGPQSVTAAADEQTITVVAEGDGPFEYQLDNGQFQLENHFENVAAGLHAIYVRDLNGCATLETMVLVAPLGIGGHLLSNLDFWPNPVKDRLTISLENQTIKSITVTDISGKDIMSKLPEAATVRLDLTALSGGLYFVRINTESQEQTIKIIKQ